MPAPTFEVLAFAARVASSSVAVIELDGRFTARGARGLGRPRLLVERGTTQIQCDPVPGPDAAAGPDGVPWHAAFAVPLALVEGARFALEVGRDLLVELPSPRLGDAGEDAGARLARLAREANDLRRRLDEAVRRATVAEDHATAAIAEVQERAADAVAAARAEAAEAIAASEERIGTETLATEERAAAELAAAHHRERDAIRAAQERAAAEISTAQESAKADVLTAREHARIETEAAREQARAEIEAARDHAQAEIQAARSREVAAVDAAADRVAIAVAAAEASLARAREDVDHPGEDERVGDEQVGPAGQATAGALQRAADADAASDRPSSADADAPSDRPGPADADAPSDRPGPADAVAPSDRPGPAGGQAAFERRAAAARAGDLSDDDETVPRPLAAEALPRLPEIPPTAETEIIDAGADKTVRVLSGRRRPRHRAEDEEEPTRISPTATRVGARSISPAASRTRHRGPQRTVALFALAVAIVAFLLVVVLRVGPI